MGSGLKHVCTITSDRQFFLLLDADHTALSVDGKMAKYRLAAIGLLQSEAMMWSGLATDSFRQSGAFFRHRFFIGGNVAHIGVLFGEALV